VQDEWRLMTNADWSLLLLTDFPIWGVLRQAQGRVTSCPAENFLSPRNGKQKGWIWLKIWKDLELSEIDFADRFKNPIDESVSGG